MEFFKTQEALEYFCGFVISDGHMRQNSRNRGSISIEIKKDDSNILYQIQNEIKNITCIIKERTRNTNFAKNYTSSILQIFNQQFREEMVKLGIPYGRKDNVKIPDWAMQNNNFWRGMIDGDGSLGLYDNNKQCFVSLISKSEDVAQKYLKLIENITGKVKNQKRNKRDNVYNICIFNEDAQELVKFLDYENSTISLNRKKESAKKVLTWNRPKDMVKKTWQVKKWTKNEDQYILTHSLQESIQELKRSSKSIKTRIWRLSNAA